MHKFINWSSVIRQLQDAGMSQKEIGQAAGMSQPMVSRISAGKQDEPSHSEGEAFKALFAKTFPDRCIPEVLSSSARAIGGAEPFAEVQMIAAADVQPGRA